MSNADHGAAAGRVIGWGMLGGLCGLLVGLGSVMLLAPTVDPQDSLEYEWYTPYALIVILPAEILAGIFAGALVAAEAGTPAGCLRDFARTLLGAIVGLALTAACVNLLRISGVPWSGLELWVSLLIQAVGAIAVLVRGVARDAARDSLLRPGHQG